MVPSTVVMPREGSFALASFGRVRKVQEPAFAAAAGRKSFALKRILEAVGIILKNRLRALLLAFGLVNCWGIKVSRTSFVSMSDVKREYLYANTIGPNLASERMTLIVRVVA